MSIEIFDEIFSRLRLRNLGLTPTPVSVRDGSTYQFDIEDSFIPPDEDLDLIPKPKIHPDSEPE